LRKLSIRAPPAAGKLPFTQSFEAFLFFCLAGARLPVYFFPSCFRLLSIPTIIPDGGFFLFNFAASIINFFTPGR